MEKREYERIKVGAVGSFYVNSKDKYIGDFGGMIKDISEGGIRIETNWTENEDVLRQIEVGGCINFEAYDEYEWYDGNNVSDIFSGRVKIIHKRMENDMLVLGCKIESSNNYERYIKDRKISVFISHLRHDTKHSVQA